MAKIGIIGAGTWGTALAVLLNNNGHEVTIWQQYPSTYQNVDGWILSYFYSQSLLKIKAKTSFI